MAVEKPLATSLFGIILIGASATGKSTVAAALEADSLVKVQPTFTTRNLRPCEQTDQPCDHSFLSDERFGQLARAGNFITTACLYGSEYGVPVPELDDLPPLFVLKPSLVEPVLVRFGQFRTYQLEASEATVKRRMLDRGQSQADIAQRLRQHALETAMGRRLADVIFRNERRLDETISAVAEQIQNDQTFHTLMLQ